MPAVPKPKRSLTKSKKSKCVELSGDIVTHLGFCLRCGKSSVEDTIDPHHIVPGRHDRLVARTDAQVPFCRHLCHRWAHDFPDAFKEWIDILHPGRRQMLEAVARVQGKVDWDIVLATLQEEWAIVGG